MTPEQEEVFYRALRLDILRYTKLSELALQISWNSIEYEVDEKIVWTLYQVRDSLPVKIHCVAHHWVEENGQRQRLISKQLARAIPIPDILADESRTVREATIKRFAGISAINDDEYKDVLAFAKSELISRRRVATAFYKRAEKRMFDKMAARKVIP